MGRDTWISIGLAVSVAVAFGMFSLVGDYAKDPFTREKLIPRFPERSLNYSLEDLQDLAEKSDLRKFYVFPLLFPLDFIVMLALAGSMGAAIWYWFGQFGPAWAMLALIPLIYFVSDLAEDCFLAWMLQPDNAGPATICTLKTLTAIKLGSVIASIILTVAAFLLWLYRTLSGTLS
jgi:hypothetical protein